MTDMNVHLKLIDCCRVENRVYFVNITFNGLFYLDIEDLSIHFVHKFSFEQENARELAVLSLYYENEIYFFPNNTNVILKYNITEQCEQSMPLLDYDEKVFVTAGIIRRQNLVYIFPLNFGNGVYVLDLENQKVEKDRELSSLFEGKTIINNVILQHENSIMICLFGSNQFVEVDLNTKRIVKTETLDEDIKIYSTCYDGSNYWILSRRSTDIYEWNRENNILQVYKNENPVWEEPRFRPYSNMVFLENDILVLNGSLKNILHINKEKKTIDDPIAMPDGYRLINNYLYKYIIYNCYTVLDDKVFIFPCRGNMLLIYDKASGCMSGKEFTVSEQEVPYLMEVVRQDFTGENVCSEKDDLDTLANLMKMIENNKSESTSSDAEDIGKLIYKQINNSLW